MELVSCACVCICVCVLGMTKVKVGKEDLSSVEFVEKRRSALER